MEASTPVRILAIQMADSKKRPRAIRKQQKRAWGAVVRAKNRLEKAAKALDMEMANAKTMMKSTAIWERQDRELREKFIRRCEQVRNAASKAEMETVKAIQMRLEGKLLEQAERVPVLRRAMLPRP